jgi:hypothetical protein
MHTFRERLKFQEFTAVVEKMVSIDWSKGRQAPNTIAQRVLPHVFASAFQVKGENRRIVQHHGDRFIVPSNGMGSADRSEIHQAARDLEQAVFSTFDDYKEARFKVGCRFNSVSINVLCRFIWLRRLAKFSIALVGAV